MTAAQKEITSQLFDAVEQLQRLRAEGADETVIGAAVRVGALQAQEEIGRTLDGIACEYEMRFQAERDRCERVVLTAAQPLVERSMAELLHEIAKKIREGARP